MKNLFTLVTAMLLTAGSLQAEQIFVLFDGTCGDRVRYEQAIAQQPRTDYYAYQFSLQGGDRLSLETGAEGATVQNFLPQGYIYCGDQRLNLELANRVNGGVDQVYILLPTAGNKYAIQPVVMASVLQRRGASFSFFSPFTGFRFDTENGIIGENLAVNNEGAKVYFEGRETSPCTGYFLFRQLNVGGAYPVIDYKISPEIGVYERRLGSDGISTTGGTITAREVNGMPVVNYLNAICASATTRAQAGGSTPTAPAYGSPQPGTYGSQQPAPPQPYYAPPQQQQPGAQPESLAYAQVNPQAPARVNTVNHTVVKGETLYAVSRKYGTTVDAIKAANGLNSNTLFPGQQLVVTTTMTPSANEVAIAPTVPTTPYNPGNVANSNPGAAQPTPYAATAAPQAYGGSPQTSRGGQTAVYGEDVHVVQPGETLASIALRYGFTSAKFREINGIGSNEVVRIGQQLKTTDCDCPVLELAPAAAEPAAYGQPAAAPQSYGQPATVPQPYGNQPAANQPATEAYRTPQGYQAPQASPVPATTTPKAPAPTTINNNPNFGMVVPNASAPPSSTMGQLEGRGTAAPRAQPTTDPATYNAYPGPAAAPNQYQSPNPVPNAYGGTPVGVNTQPAAQPNNRSFHLVQEGESLFSIARRYGITTDQLRALNKLDNGTVIVPFQKLYVN